MPASPKGSACNLLPRVGIIRTLAFNFFFIFKRLYFKLWYAWAGNINAVPNVARRGQKTPLDLELTGGCELPRGTGTKLVSSAREVHLLLNC